MTLCWLLLLLGSWGCAQPDNTALTAHLYLLPGVSALRGFSAKLSPDHRLLALLGPHGVLSVVPVTPDMQTLPPVLNTATQSFFVLDYAWCGAQLLLSGIPVSMALDEDSIIALSRNAVLRVWEPADHALRTLLPYSVSLILPNRTGDKVALFGCKGDPLAQTSNLTIYDMQRKKAITTLTFPTAGTLSSMSFPVGWSKDSQALYFVSTPVAAPIVDISDAPPFSRPCSA
jgi:hypothetical protein